MAKRGAELRQHILLAAKQVFIECGFERASMDLVAARAETSKRTLYAHFESKEKLFLAVVELVRALFLRRLQSPAEFGEAPAEALTGYLARYLETLCYEPTVRMCRIAMNEAARFPEGAAGYFEVLYTEVRRRLADYLTAHGRSADEAERLLGATLHPRWPRVLFGVEPAHPTVEDAGWLPAADRARIRAAVAAALS